MEATDGGEKTVCVTGASGFIGAWLVRLLLDRGYTINATVKNLHDDNEVKHLQALGLPPRLRLFQIDLLDYDSIAAAIDGVTGVFHLASPCTVDKILDPENEVLGPAIKGTNNVLMAAKELGVRRVVITSSVSAIVPSPYWAADVVKNEDCWTDVEYCKQKELWYPASKTLAEKAAWEFAKEKGLDVVVVNPGTVMGPVIPPTLKASMLMLLRLLQGCTETYENFFMGSVHVKDVALAHILVYENPSATGRHLCVEAISHYGDFAAKVAELYPEHQVPSLPKDTQPGLLRMPEIETASPDLSRSNLSSLKSLTLDGQLCFDNIEHASKDFGNRYHFLPEAVLQPKTVRDISSIVKHIYDMGSTSPLTIAARGHGHSLEGQAQAHNGLVINMEMLQEQDMRFHTGELPYVDVSGGELWINILQEGLKHGYAPKSWTDYLHLTVGGTLSNAGISGQAFQHGPQIDNVYQLEVVTGKGDIVTCTSKQNADLFYGVLGGLGQFGIITRARISVERAPRRVKWIRMLYTDFSMFCRDQEHLISSQNSFDYVEGFVIVNRSGILNNWRSSFNPRDPLQASEFHSEGKTLYCLEIAKYFNPEENCIINQHIDSLLTELNYIQSTLFISEVSYLEFLDRVHTSENNLRQMGLWEVPHPWLNLLVPKSKIHDFVTEVFGNILVDTSNGPVLIYPVNKSRWNNNTSMVTPEEDIFYLVAFLSSAVPSSTGTDGLEHILMQHNKILEFCNSGHLGVKQYLPSYSTRAEWKAHYGTQWKAFSQKKATYDPLSILAPGQKIFHKAMTFS